MLTGQAVKFDVSGMEPDFDPLYQVVISATLHDSRPVGAALPDALLILSCYLEVFKPDTTPVLPDLLHPDKVATSLAGFLQGKAALVNAAGRVAYKGSMLGEIFTNNAVHLVVRLYYVKAGPNASLVQLSGAFTLYKGGTQKGRLYTASAASLAALAAPRGPPLSWQSVVQSLAVAPPPMMGTAGGSQRSQPATCNVGGRLVACAGSHAPHAATSAPPTRPATRPAPHAVPSPVARPALSAGSLVLWGAALLLAVLAGLFWWRLLRGNAAAEGPRTPSPPGH
jgi:hypothetical protein